jgi:hypothetical protein
MIEYRVTAHHSHSKKHNGVHTFRVSRDSVPVMPMSLVQVPEYF